MQITLDGRPSVYGQLEIKTNNLVFVKITQFVRSFEQKLKFTKMKICLNV